MSQVDCQQFFHMATFNIAVATGMLNVRQQCLARSADSREILVSLPVELETIVVDR